MRLFLWKLNTGNAGNYLEKQADLIVLFCRAGALSPIANNIWAP